MLLHSRYNKEFFGYWSLYESINGSKRELVEVERMTESGIVNLESCGNMTLNLHTSVTFCVYDANFALLKRNN